jgi:hypothetical protein
MLLPKEDFEPEILPKPSFENGNLLKSSEDRNVRGELLADPTAGDLTGDASKNGSDADGKSTHPCKLAEEINTTVVHKPTSENEVRLLKLKRMSEETWIQTKMVNI